MPEGHSVRRLARQFGDVFGGRQLAVSSPQGRFAAGAALLDGHTLVSADAHGKHLFLHFDHGLVLHVHLGLYGAWNFGGDSTFAGASSIGAPRRVGEREAPAEAYDADASYAGPPAPVGAVRVRLVSGHGWADLRGATTCAAITAAEADAVSARLGPDPLRNVRGDAARFVARLQGRRTPVAALLMDQAVIAGVGNVYRAEVLFRRGLDPWVPGSAVDDASARRLWQETALLMKDGVADGRIITTPARYWSGSAAGPAERTALKSAEFPDGADAHYVYKRQGLPCRVCRTTVLLAELAGRKLYWCPSCQA